jgi:hypothetical protein
MHAQSIMKHARGALLSSTAAWHPFNMQIYGENHCQRKTFKQNKD